MNDIILVSADNLAAMIDKSLDLAFNRHAPRAEAREENKTAKDIAEIKRELVLLKKQIRELQFAVSHMLTPQVKSLTDSVNGLRDQLELNQNRRPVDTASKADLNP